MPSISIAAHSDYGIPQRALRLSADNHNFVINHTVFKSCFPNVLRQHVKTGAYTPLTARNTIPDLKEKLNKIQKNWDNTVYYLGHSWNNGTVLVSGTDPDKDGFRISGEEFGNFLAKILPMNNFNEINLILHACWINPVEHSQGFIAGIFQNWYSLRPNRKLTIYTTKFQSFSNGPTMSVRTTGVETNYTDSGDYLSPFLPTKNGRNIGNINLNNLGTIQNISL